jgi:hypothetical protein
MPQIPADPLWIDNCLRDEAPFGSLVLLIQTKWEIYHAADLRAKFTSAALGAMVMLGMR